MTRDFLEVERQLNLRLKAISQLAGHQAPTPTGPTVPAALGVLYKLASSPETAPEALAVLHELQVHQVELEIQGEELSRSVAECEAALLRQTQLYDFAPAGIFTVDDSTTVYEMNLRGAQLLGCERDALLGRRLERFFTEQSAHALRELLAAVRAGRPHKACLVTLRSDGGTSDSVYVSAEADPAGERFLLALFEAGEKSARALGERGQRN
jgi:PAS domain S-box-containing protein